MITIQNLHKYYQKLHVLKGINLEFDDGKRCIALIGPNACGKTTLIKCLLNLVTPQSGEVIISGRNVKDDPAIRKLIGFMPQAASFPKHLSVAETFRLIRSVRAEADNTDDELYRSFRLDAIATKKMGALSGGTVQKVSAALAFMFHPQIIILDEPFAGLDPLASGILKEKIQKEKENGKLIFITSHVISELDNLASHIIFMEEGRIIFYKSVHMLLEETGKHTITDAIMKILIQTENE
ncbi:ABC transporter ATP-binding protein [Proteiniphilum sp. X52]|uniref:ABC transporter ATP-binding protein n=1 Tax=Proteiniphilum sp. X52 TaxID=2382159 RepID=UPI000F09B84E|nr:ABC transporter ATP-binding protein [Proteiniphilum sp. X52]RNC66856.1 ABC transporter ATP-binding protein [Proteiniphilum sp. X52]